MSVFRTSLVLGKDDKWLGEEKRYMVYEVKDARPCRRPKKTWQEVVENDLWSLPLEKFDAIDCKKLNKLIRGRQVSGDESGRSAWCILLIDLVPAHVGGPGESTVNRVRLLLSLLLFASVVYKV